ncbi:MAG: hypothetical protein HC923_04510 [Myxococcales bacterium]|nr:hypothetical protein [Myxococcales bacterium]
MTVLRRRFATFLLGGLLSVSWPASGHPTPVEKPAEQPKTGLTLEVRPPEVQVFLNGKDLGTAGKLSFIETKPGMLNLRLVHGGDEVEHEIAVKKAKSSSTTTTSSDRTARNIASLTTR